MVIWKRWLLPALKQCSQAAVFCFQGGLGAHILAMGLSGAQILTMGSGAQSLIMRGGGGDDVAALLEPMPSAADFRLPTDHEVWLIQNLLGEELDVVLWEWAVFGARPTGSDLKRGHCWCV